MQSLPFEYHEEAIREAREAYEWYAERSTEAADRFWEQLVRARVMVTEFPQAWTPYYHGTRVYQLHKFPYGLVYQELSEVIHGLAVCHFRRRPGYWRSRIRR